VYSVYGDRFSFLVTTEEAGGSYCAMAVLVSPNGGPGPHLHEDADEQFYVIEGALTYTIAGETFRATTGDLIFIPRRTVHAFVNGDAPSRLLATFTPGANVEQEFLGAGTRIEE
jgi:quercetin dioxygenase-like cupin family protein